MITAVDTNILIDVLEPDPAFGPPSRDALKRCLQQGSVVACEVVWAEVAVAYGDAPDDAGEALNHMGIQFSPMNIAGALKSAQCWYTYLKKAAKGGRIAADFLIGGHAQVQCDRLLTRDRGFYREYFKKLKVESP